MASNPRVLGLLEEILDAGKAPEEVCRNYPELLPEVRRRWQEFRLIDDQLGVLLPGLRTVSGAAPSELAPPMVGLPQVSGYEVEAVLGVGGMGVVFRARHLRLNRVVALKMILAGASAGSLQRDRFQREAEAVARLQHQNVVQIYDVGESDGCPYFTMEFVEGGSLAQKLVGAPQPARPAAQLLAVLASAVQAAHQSGIVHRDLKPANILLALLPTAGGPPVGGQTTVDQPTGREADGPTWGTPKISDFGLARRLDGEPGLTRTGLALGTPSYMAPEQAQGKTDTIGPAADVYALGAILYELLTGRPPFRAETAAATMLQVICQDPVPPSRLNSNVPRDLETICLKCLHKDPRLRYATAVALADDLSRFLRGETIAARRVGAAARLWKWAWRRPAAAGLIAAVVLLAAGAGAGTWQLSRQRAAARDRQAQTDQDVRRVLDQARALLEKGWQAADLAIMTEAAAEGNRAESMARSGGVSPPVQEEVDAFRDGAKGRLSRAENDRALLKALLDVSDPQETVRAIALAQPSLDPQYAAAFRRWGLDVDGAPEDEVVARLGAEPDVVVQELIAALDDWMLERRRQKRPEAEWRRLLRVAVRLDRSERHRRLRQLLVSGSPPRPESVAWLVGAGPPWAALWEVAHGTGWRELWALRGEINPASEPVMTVVLLARACAAVGDAAGAEQVLRQAAAARPGRVVLLDALGKLLERQGPAQRAKAIEYHRAARAVRPGLGIVLSMALIRAGRADEAEEVVQEMIRQQPDNAALYNTLGISLFTRQKFAAAEAAYRKATELPPGLAEAHYNLGLVLASQGRRAEAAYRKAIEVEPDFALAYNNLALELSQQQKHAAAETACRKAIELQPDLALAHNGLGMALVAQGKHRAAEESCRKAIALKPDLAEAYTNLGNALRGLDELAAAEAAHRKAIALKPDLADAYNNLGVVLASQGKYRDGTAAYLKAIALKPDLAEAYTNLGMALASQGQHGAAEAAFRKAIDRRPDFVVAYMNLTRTLVAQAKFDEGLTFIKRGHDLLSARDPLREQTGSLLARCQRYRALDARLPRVLQGAEEPANAAEQIEFAQLCILKELYAAAVRFYDGALNADPKLAENVPAATRYNAACAAARAGCARGRDTDALDDKERARWRRQAREWLRQDLIWWGKKLDDGNAQSKADVRWHMQFWQSDSDLAGLRDPGTLEALSPAERKECLALWEGVAALLGRVQTLK